MGGSACIIRGGNQPAQPLRKVGVVCDFYRCLWYPQPSQYIPKKNRLFVPFRFGGLKVKYALLLSSDWSRNRFVAHLHPCHPYRYKGIGSSYAWRSPGVLIPSMDMPCVCPGWHLQNHDRRGWLVDGPPLPFSEIAAAYPYSGWHLFLSNHAFLHLFSPGYPGYHSVTYRQSMISRDDVTWWQWWARLQPSFNPEGGKSLGRSKQLCRRVGFRYV